MVAPNQDTWTWTGTTWISTGRPIPASGTADATDTNDHVIVVFGASDNPNMWLYGNNAWRTISPR
jgi:hypothetical protein